MSDPSTELGSSSTAQDAPTTSAVQLPAILGAIREAVQVEVSSTMARLAPQQNPAALILIPTLLGMYGRQDHAHCQVMGWLVARCIKPVGVVVSERRMLRAPHRPPASPLELLYCFCSSLQSLRWRHGRFCGKWRMHNPREAFSIAFIARNRHLRAPSSRYCGNGIWFATMHIIQSESA